MPPGIATFDQWLLWSLRQRELAHKIRMMRQQEYALQARSAQETGLIAFLCEAWARITKFAASLTGGSKHRA